MLIDMHVHTVDFSSCSQLDLEQAVMRAKEIGLHGLCITDHESNGIAPQALQMARKHQFFIMVGMEILTLQGDLLVFGLNEAPSERIDAGTLLRELDRRRGIAVSAHPFRDNGRGMGNLFCQYPLLNGVEVLNGRTKDIDNQRAVNLARKRRLNMVGGSDAHRLDEVGKYATLFPDGIRDLQDFREAFFSQQVLPMLIKNNKYEEAVHEE